MRFLTTQEISGEIERVMREARVFILLVSPYVEVAELYLQRLRDAADKGVRLSLVFRAGQERKLDRVALTAIRGLRLMSLDRLHAKCYLNENDAIVTSMNLYDNTQYRNREIGITVCRAAEGDMYQQVLAEATALENAASKDYQLVTSVAADGRDEGTCIRCGSVVELDPEKPLCDRCYTEWARYRNPDYVERYCHFCGREAQTTIAKPLCRACFRDSAL